MSADPRPAPSTTGEERLRALLRHAFDVVLLLDEDARVREVFLGRNEDYLPPAGMLVDHLAWDLVHPDEEAVARRYWERTLARPKPMPPIELRFPRADGSWGWAELVAENALDDPAVRAVVVNLHDVTDRHLAQEALRRSERRYRAIVQTAQEAIAVLDEEGIVTLANPRMGDLLAVGADDLLGRRLDDFGVALPTEPGPTPAELDRRDGRRLSVLFSTTPLREGGRLVTITDTTALTDLQQRLAEAERLEALGRFAAGVAHDFNNVLAVVRGHADLMSAALPEDAPVVRNIAGIGRAVQRAADLIGQLLAFGRGGSDQAVVVDLREQAVTAVEFCRPLLPPSVRLDLASTAHPLPVLADPARLQRVLVNLVVNARDAITDEGRIEVRLTAAPPADGGPGGAVLAVTDTGAGMSAETLARCTEPFFTTKGAAGTGLGLSTAHGIVVRHGGSLHVDSAPGAGTTVTVRLPLAG